MKFEASPSIYTNGNDPKAKTLYQQYFGVSKLGNLKGSKPVKGAGFWESDEAFNERLKDWEDHEKNVLFEGWICKDMKHFQVLHHEKDEVILNFEFDKYSITVDGKKFEFPVLPERIDDLITDFRRIGVKLFWKESVVEQYGYKAITSDTKVMEHYKIIRNMF
jgi:hypothetical protein